MTLDFVWIVIGIDLSVVWLATQLGAGMTPSDVVLRLLAVLGSLIPLAYLPAMRCGFMSGWQDRSRDPSLSR
ncbi:hypothetical protein [Polycladomyces subterraneus]|uniref:Uncharacterized protein n=1 Tax=Polycladomyces subterraneus TaxID=1016997 RepID=A0ABT8IKQ3_9BACL|nr:hypothetical protein [Polycladomyces subterraneus]MDN4593370.1 hypothetical protein [Polycladomyces subterraneus]